MFAKDITPRSVINWLKNAETGDYRVKNWDAKQNLQLCHRGTPFGGWDSGEGQNPRRAHWYVLGSRAGQRRSLLCRHGFEERRRENGYVHWQLKGAENVDAFRAVIGGLTGVPIGQE